MRHELNATLHDKMLILCSRIIEVLISPTVTSVTEAINQTLSADAYTREKTSHQPKENSCVGGLGGVATKHS